jgi:hypothetical protein
MTVVDVCHVTHKMTVVDMCHMTHNMTQY